MLDGLDGIQWDEGNAEKCEKHGVSRAEIEAFFYADEAPTLFRDPSPTEPRFRAIGRSMSGRYLFVVFTIRTNDEGKFIRPISARFMHQKEIDYYEQAAPPPL